MSRASAKFKALIGSIGTPTEFDRETEGKKKDTSYSGAIKAINPNSLQKVSLVSVGVEMQKE